MTVGTMTTGLATEHCELLSVALQHPEGIEPLFEAQLESAAALYQVRPERVEALRSLLHGQVARVAALEAARGANAGQPAVEPPARHLDARALLALAAKHEDDFAWLTQAPVELAATRFGAHVFVVEEARRLLARA
jgi:hypothetical protein